MRHRLGVEVLFAAALFGLLIATVQAQTPPIVFVSQGANWTPTTRQGAERALLEFLKPL